MDSRDFTIRAMTREHDPDEPVIRAWPLEEDARAAGDSAAIGDTSTGEEAGEEAERESKALPFAVYNRALIVEGSRLIGKFATLDEARIAAKDAHCTNYEIWLGNVVTAEERPLPQSIHPTETGPSSGAYEVFDTNELHHVSHGTFATLEEARGCVSFDHLTAYEIWCNDQCVEESNDTHTAFAEHWRTLFDTRADAALLECLANEPESPVGAECWALMTRVDALLSYMTDITNGQRRSIRAAAVEQMNVWYFG